MRHILSWAVALTMAAPAHAQIKPEAPDLPPITLPTRTPGRPGEPVRPTQPTGPIGLPGGSSPVPVVDRGVAITRPVDLGIVSILRPAFTVRPQGASRPGFVAGQRTSMQIAFTGLAGMKAVRMQAFRPGCHVEPYPTLSSRPGALRADTSQVAVFSSRRGQFGSAEREPVLVAADGTALFTVDGRPGSAMFITATNRPDEWNPFDANRKSIQSGDASGFLPFLHEVPVKYRNAQTPSALECQPEATIAVLDSADQWMVRDASGRWVPEAGVTATAVTGAGWYFKPYRRVVIGDTWRLRTLLQPTMRKKHGLSLSACEGISGGFHGDHPVGVRERAGDIAFVIRSGPLGTDCIFSTMPGALPEGVFIDRVRFEQTRVNDKCYTTTRTIGEMVADLSFAVFDHIGLLASVAGHAMKTGEITSGVNSPGGEIQRLAKLVRPPIAVRINHERIAGQNYMNQTIANASVHGFVNPYSEPMRQEQAVVGDFIEPFIGRVTCDMAGSNDHEIAVRIDEVVALVPEGVQFF